MKKGLNVTLMTVAFAMLCMQAMAMAPVISDIPSPVIGNEGVTGSNTYLWIDAIDLDANVQDPGTDGVADSAIKWSYYISGTPYYRLNNVDSLTTTESGNKDVINAPGAKQLNGSTHDPAEDGGAGDGLSKTVTIRNIKYTPVTGGTVAPTGTGLVDSQTVTLFASDGTTYSSLGKSIMFYTDIGGSDRFGTAEPTGTGTPITLPALPSGWTFNTALTLSGTVTATSAAGQVCLETTNAGSNFNVNGWYSNFGYIPLVANNVYKFHMKVNGNQAAGQTVPFWDVVVNNFDGVNGLNLYGADFYFLDNEDGDSSSATNGHGANAPTAAGRDYYIYWCPSPMSTTAWNDTTKGVFATSVGNNKNMYLMFRVLDTNNAAITPDLDGGRICMTAIDATRYDFTTMQTVSSGVYASQASMTTSNMQVQPLFSTVDRTNGITITNTGSSASSDITNVWPGDATLSIGTPSSYDDNFPIAWANNELFMISVQLSAPATADETHPYDVFWVGMDTATNEFVTENFVTYKQNFCGMPKTGNPQTYRSFFYSHNVSLTPITNLRRLRPRFYVGNSVSMNDMVKSDGTIVANGTTGGAAMNTGAIRMHSMRVDKVTFPN